VSDILPTTIVFKTPIATNNVCLMNQLVDIVIVNPSTGKTASCPACFKYYPCPTSGTASPSAADGTVATTVVISGANFEGPVTANFSSAGGLAALNVTSVSANAIVLTMPPLSQLLGGAPACTDVAGNINISFLGLTCAPISVPFTYHLSPPFASTAAPNNLNQDGSPFGGPLGSPATITVTGGNFTDPMTVQLIKDGSVVANTPVNNAIVANANTLTFAAPAVLNASLNQQNCVLGVAVTGVKFVPTSFGVRLKSARTNCTVDLPNVLVYNPLDTTCTVALTITTDSLPAGTATVAYGPITMDAVGGTGGGYSWSASGLPAALTINSGTGVISGIPAAAGTSTVTVTVTDSAANTGSRTYSLVIN
jgi:Putative Ig domain